jgi:hypothetical protein
MILMSGLSYGRRRNDVEDDYDYYDEDDVEFPEPHSVDDPWWNGARADW